MSRRLKAEKPGDWGFGFGLVSFQVTDMLLGELTISRNLLTLGGELAQGQLRFQMWKHQNKKTCLIQ